jgi:hypothetical protein
MAGSDSRVLDGRQTTDRPPSRPDGPEIGSAPVVQTIARNASVIWSEDIASRLAIWKDIRRLYELRSAIVPAGNRPIVWGSANLAQIIAEGLFWVVLRKGKLSAKHQTFIEELSLASFGSAWPATALMSRSAMPEA